MSYGDWYYKDLKEQATLILSHESLGGYEWDTVEIWERHSDGRLFLAADSGCSCNSMGDGFDSFEDMRPITNFDTVRQALDSQSDKKLNAAGVIDLYRIVQSKIDEPDPLPDKLYATLYEEAEEELEVAEKKLEVALGQLEKLKQKVVYFINSSPIPEKGYQRLVAWPEYTSLLTAVGLDKREEV